MKNPVQVFRFQVLNTANGQEVDIHIDGDIVDASTQAMIEAWFGDTTSTSYKSFRDSLSNSSARIFNVIINSPGGHVGDAMAIHDYLVSLQDSGKVVNTIGRGIVASSATLILMASKNPKMSANSLFMMHNVSGGMYGDVNQMESFVATMRKFNNMIRDMYANKSGARPEEITKLMNAETWLSAKEAKEKGFIAEIEGDAVITNKVDLTKWSFQNTAILNSYNAQVQSDEEPTEPNQILDSMKKLFTDFKNNLAAAMKNITGTGAEAQTSIADTIGTQMEALGEKVEEEVNTSIQNFAKSEDFSNAIKNAVDAAVKPLQDKITELETANKDLETEIANKIGNRSTTPPAPGQVEDKQIGSFS